MADQYPYQTAMEKWALIARALDNEIAAVEFDRYAATGVVDDSGLLLAIDTVSSNPVGLLTGSGGELRKFAAHVRGVMRRNKIPVPA